MHSIEHLPNVKVSDTLAEIIFDMCRNVQPTKETLDTLKSSERELFDLLLYISGLSKSKREIIQKLYLYNAISMNNGKAYLKQF